MSSVVKKGNQKDHKLNTEPNASVSVRITSILDNLAALVHATAHFTSIASVAAPFN